MKIEGAKIHFMGAGGIGVSALAGIALERGAFVSGCDREENAQTEMLRALGAEIHIGHSPAHMTGQDLLVYTSAVPPSHPELLAAGTKSIRRGEFLAQMVSQSTGIGVSGTHGKTTTTWMTAHIQISCGYDPTVFVGGAVKELGGNFRVGGATFISELDESDGSFLLPKLDIAVITNIESEHLAYYKTEERLHECFRKYANNMEGPRLLIGNLDCPVTAEIIRARKGATIGFALKDTTGYHVRDLDVQGEDQVGRLFFADRELGRFKLGLPGRHNVINALAAIAVAIEVGIPADAALQALSNCQGVGRRMEYLGTHNHMRIYTDYAHHPSEVRAAIEGARQLCKGRLLVIFQPHLFSRTRDYFRDFADALSLADCALIADIYPAREEPIFGVSSALIVEAANEKCIESCAKNTHGKLVGPYELCDVLAAVEGRNEEYEMAVFMGAGDIEKIARDYVGAVMREV